MKDYLYEYALFYALCTFFILIFVGFFVRKLYEYHGVSIIRLAKTAKVGVNHTGRSGNIKQYYAYVEYQDYDSIRNRYISELKGYKVGKYVYVIHPIYCNDGGFLEYTNYDNYPKIHDFAFLKDTTFYTYHDYSLIDPTLVYYHVGFNVGYKAVRDSVIAQDSTTNLSFIDVCGKHQRIKYNVKNYTSVPDTFLVFRNINENIDDRFIVCAPEVNTPENWAKISDYGYIFHYDVYSKEEIESQCPQIRNYVEKYKELHK